MGSDFVNNEKLDAKIAYKKINEFIDQAQATYDGADTIVRHAVSNAVRRFGGMNDTHMRIMKSAFKTYDLDIF